MTIWEKHSKNLLPTREIKREKKSDVKSALSACLDGHDWVPEDLDFKESFKRQIQNLSGSIYPTMMDALKYHLSTLPKELKEILELSEKSDGDLKLLKEIRDDVAHANKTRKRDVNLPIALGNKVFVLLLYHAYTEMGIPLKIIAQFFSPNFHKTVRDAKLNHRAIDFASERATLLVISDSDYNVLKDKRYLYPVFERSREGRDVLSQRVSEVIQQWHLSGSAQINDVRDVVASEYPEVERARQEYVGCAYVKTPSLNAPEHLFSAILVSI